MARILQLKSLGVVEAVVFRDSRLLIQALITPTKVNNLKLARLLKRIQLLTRSFQKIKFFHILRILNTETDKVANKATLLSKGGLIVNNVVRWTPL